MDDVEIVQILEPPKNLSTEGLEVDLRDGPVAANELGNGAHVHVFQGQDGVAVSLETADAFENVFVTNLSESV
eukprot:1122238-Amorphochlora_amoeboformis.AAC.1